MSRRRLVPVTVAAVTLGLIPVRARAHVRYVTDGPGENVSPVTFLSEVLGEPANLAMVVGAGAMVTAAVVFYLRVRPLRPEIAVGRETLREYTDLVPWLLRLAIGLPVVGAGFGGYFFSPAVPITFRLFNVTIGFMIVFGLAARGAALVGLGSYLVGLLFAPELLLASEFVGGFLGIVLLGSGRPSADQVLGRVVASQGTRVPAIEAGRKLVGWLGRRTAPYEAYAPTAVRLGLGLNFIYLGAYEKLANPGRANLVVEEYALTSVIPMDAGMWILGAGLTEVVLGIALLAGAFVRASATVAFLLFSVTLFAIPDEPVLAHVSLFGMVSVLMITGSGPFALDNWLSGRYPSIETGVDPA